MHRRLRPSLCKSLVQPYCRTPQLPFSPDSIPPPHGFVKLLRQFHLVPTGITGNLYTPTPPFHRNPRTQPPRTGTARRWSSGSDLDVDREVDTINLKFAEAREELEMAMDSKETVYFDEEAECARDAVNEVLRLYDSLLVKLPESERGAVQRSMGLKMEQLKAEVKQLED
ncbi:unnamed protein product [Linum tenue]|uniref:Late embryogenesis abundant protein n=2 Tax=Linum tenue TaxID=586396 RepID=A0AAV0RWQ9_9ROSI|nr:unnamed protein product [Linum tenue]